MLMYPTFRYVRVMSLTIVMEYIVHGSKNKNDTRSKRRSFVFDNLDIGGSVDPPIFGQIRHLFGQKKTHLFD